MQGVTIRYPPLPRVWSLVDRQKGVITIDTPAELQYF